ncbi:TPA: hypothetical protein HA246_00810 [Candidatus Woesearchaeota archaeon]|nr:hypothetical protein [Candidatus Woesearchaeota archaeon]
MPTALERALERVIITNPERNPPSSFRTERDVLVVDSNALGNDNSRELVDFIYQRGNVVTAVEVEKELAENRRLLGIRDKRSRTQRSLNANDIGSIIVGIIKDKGWLYNINGRNPEESKYMDIFSQHLPKYQACALTKKYLSEWYGKIKALLEWRVNGGDRITICDLRERGSAVYRVLDKLLVHTDIVLTPEIDRMRTELAAQKAESAERYKGNLNQLCNYLSERYGLRIRCVDKQAILDEMVDSFNSSVDRIWIRMLGGAIRQEHINQVSQRIQQSSEPSLADKNLVLLSYIVAHPPGTRSVIYSSDRDLGYLLKIRKSLEQIPGETPRELY